MRYSMATLSVLLPGVALLLEQIWFGRVGIRYVGKLGWGWKGAGWRGRGSV